VIADRRAAKGETSEDKARTCREPLVRAKVERESSIGKAPAGSTVFSSPSAQSESKTEETMRLQREREIQQEGATKRTASEI